MQARGHMQFPGSHPVSLNRSNLTEPLTYYIVICYNINLVENLRLQVIELLYFHLPFFCALTNHMIMLVVRIEFFVCIYVLTNYVRLEMNKLCLGGEVWESLYRCGLSSKQLFCCNYTN